MYYSDEIQRQVHQHCERVSELCVKIGIALEMSIDDIAKLRIAGLLHDIGKISIGKSLLNKREKLTAKEWNTIKGHSETGYQLLKAVNEFESIAEYVLYHHERPDGKGYPRKLAAHEIPLHSKIISTADAYDAMTNERPYKQVLSESMAIEELKKNKGTQFDPDLVDIFIELVPLENKEGEKKFKMIEQQAIMVLQSTERDKMNDLLDEEINMQEDSQYGKYLTFALGEEVYGIGINNVTEIIGMQKINHVPELPAYMKGIINLRGRIIPIIDMRLKFSKEPEAYNDRTCIIVVNIKEMPVGLIVDNVDEVASISDGDISEPPDIKTGFNNRYVKGIGKSGSQVQLLLDCEKLFEEENLEELIKTIQH